MYSLLSTFHVCIPSTKYFKKAVITRVKMSIHVIHMYWSRSRQAGRGVLVLMWEIFLILFFTWSLCCLMKVILVVINFHFFVFCITLSIMVMCYYCSNSIHHWKEILFNYHYCCFYMATFINVALIYITLIITLSSNMTFVLLAFVLFGLSLFLQQLVSLSL